MKSISVTLQGEKALLEWREGKVYCQDYDIKDERIALALAGYGEGIGVLLVAIDNCCSSASDLIIKVEEFKKAMKKFPPMALITRTDVWPESQLFFEYYSYSPDVRFRWVGIESSILSNNTIERIFADPHRRGRQKLTMRKDLSKKCFMRLANDQDPRVRAWMVFNVDCPQDILGVLSRDSDIGVRRAVAAWGRCSAELLAMISKDKETVQRAIWRRNYFPLELQLGLIPLIESPQKIQLANSTLFIRVLKELVNDKSEEVKVAARANQIYRREQIQANQGL